MTGQPLWVRATDVLFLSYLAVVVALQRHVARLHAEIGGIPLFTGEVAIAIFCAVEVVRIAASRRQPFRFRYEDGMLAVLLAMGAVLALRGLAYGFGLAAIRDFALVYYAAFYFLTRAFLARGGTLFAVATALVTGAGAGSALTSMSFLLAPHLTWEHGAAPGAALIGWIGLVGAVLLWPVCGGTLKRLALVATGVMCTVAVYLSAYRTAGVVLVGSLAALTLLCWGSLRDPCRRALLFGCAWSLLFAAGLVAHLLLSPVGPAELPQNGTTNLRDGAHVITLRWLSPVLSVFGNGAADGRTSDSGAPDSPLARICAAARDVKRIGAMTSPQGSHGSSDFRVLAWRHALTRIRSSPLVGIGFGPPAALFPDYHCELASSALSNCGNAHNTYLTLAMRMGLAALVLFLAVNGSIALRAVRRLRRLTASRGADVAGPFLLAAWAASICYASLSLFLESPYLSGPYWVILGSLAHFGAAPEVDSPSDARLSS